MVGRRWERDKNLKGYSIVRTGRWRGGKDGDKGGNGGGRQRVEEGANGVKRKVDVGKQL